MSGPDPRPARNRGRVLDALAAATGPVSVATLTGKLGLTAGSLRHQLRELHAAGKVHQPEYGKWAIGPADPATVLARRLALAAQLRRHRRHRSTRPPATDASREPTYDPREIEARTASIRETKPEPPRRRVRVPVCKDPKGNHETD